MNKIFFEAIVLASRPITPGMIRVTFGGDGLADYPSTGIADEYMRFFFPNEETGRLHLPHIDENGRWTYPDGGQEAIRCSTYTVRAHRPEANEIDIDFVVHEGGLASEWAQKARPGDRITVNRPRGICARPADTTWQLLVCDSTGIPALSRMLEQSPRNLQTRAFIEVAAPEHEQDLPHHDFATITWLHRSGNGVAPHPHGRRRQGHADRTDTGLYLGRRRAEGRARHPQICPAGTQAPHGALRTGLLLDA